MSLVTRAGGVWVAFPRAGNPNTSLLAHFDGTNGSQTIIDDSMYAHTMACVDDASISTAQSKFGGSSLIVDASSYATAVYDTTMSFGTGDFSIDFWVRFSSDPTSGVKVLFGMTGSGTLGVYLNTTVFAVTRAGVADDVNFTHAMTTNTWYHIEVSRTSGTLRVFIDGVQKFSGANSQSYALSSGSTFAIGDASSGYRWNGWIDELRIVKGAGGHTAGFTPPTSAYTE